MHKHILLLAAAQAAAAPAAPGGFAALAGSWTCTGKAEASPLSAAHPVRATLSFAAGPAWSKVRYTEEKTKANPRPQSALERWGANAGGGYLRVVFDGEGGVGRAASAGWQDGALVWTGDYQLRGEKLTFRETFARKGPALSDVLELGQPGAWKVAASATCAPKR